MKPTQLCGFLLCASACSRERRSRCNAPICGRIARSAAFVRLSCAVSRKFSSWCADITHTHRRAASPQCIFCLAVHCIIVHFPDLPHYLFTAPSRENFFCILRTCIHSTCWPRSQLCSQLRSGQLCSELCIHLRSSSPIFCAASFETQPWNGYKFGLLASFPSSVILEDPSLISACGCGRSRAGRP